MTEPETGVIEEMKRIDESYGQVLIQLIQFFRPTHIRIENLRTKTCRCLSNLRHLEPSPLLRR